ncbi:MAG: AEC family transporter [Clostridiales bacterium]|nr:AEC family transporter [Clostridiales bacterium]
MNMSAVITQMAILFIIMAVGYAANKFKIMTADSNKLISKLVVNIAMPCTILSSVLSGEVRASGLDAAYFMLLSLGVFLLSFIVAIPLPRLLRVPKADSGLYRFMVSFGNVGFMGFPVIQSIFGVGAVFYVTLFNIPFSVLCFSVGIIMVSGRGTKLNLRVLINPTMVVSLLTVLVFYIKPSIPAVITDAVVIVGRMTTPSAMLVIGSTLACISLKEVFTEYRLYLMTIAKLLVIPILTWLILRLFVTNQLMLGVLVALSAMPTATNATMLSMEYGGNEQLASKGVFLTTLFSVATMPLLLSFLL